MAPTRSIALFLLLVCGRAMAVPAGLVTAAGVTTPESGTKSLNLNLGRKEVLGSSSLDSNDQGILDDAFMSVMEGAMAGPPSLNSEFSLDSLGLNEPALPATNILDNNAIMDTLFPSKDKAAPKKDLAKALPDLSSAMVDIKAPASSNVTSVPDPRLSTASDLAASAATPKKALSPSSQDPPKPDPVPALPPVTPDTTPSGKNVSATVPKNTQEFELIMNRLNQAQAGRQAQSTREATREASFDRPPRPATEAPAEPAQGSNEQKLARLDKLIHQREKELAQLQRNAPAALPESDEPMPPEQPDRGRRPQGSPPPREPEMASNRRASLAAGSSSRTSNQEPPLGPSRQDTSGSSPMNRPSDEQRLLQALTRQRDQPTSAALQLLELEAALRQRQAMPSLRELAQLQALATQSSQADQLPLILARLQAAAGRDSPMGTTPPAALVQLAQLAQLQRAATQGSTAPAAVLQALQVQAAAARQNQALQAARVLQALDSGSQPAFLK